MSMLVKIVAGLVAALVIVGLVMWVVGLGPFNTRPSPAAKVQTQATTAVAKADKAQGAAVGQATTKTQTTIADTAKRAANDADQIRRSMPVVAKPVSYPDGAFFRGVCSESLYAGDPVCRGYSGGASVRGAAARP